MTSDAQARPRTVVSPYVVMDTQKPVQRSLRSGAPFSEWK